MGWPLSIANTSLARAWGVAGVSVAAAVCVRARVCVCGLERGGIGAG